jgi:hypothetical protein
VGKEGHPYLYRQERESESSFITALILRTGCIKDTVFLSGGSRVVLGATLHQTTTGLASLSLFCPRNVAKEPDLWRNGTDAPRRAA